MMSYIGCGRLAHRPLRRHQRRARSHKMASAALLLLLAAAHVPRAWSTCSNTSLVSSRLDSMLAAYERGAPPATPLRARAALDLRHAAVDERTSTVRLLADLHLYWVDPRLSWNESDWQCDSALVPAERLWLPDVELLNGAAGGQRSDEGSLRARLTADASVSWITRIDVSVPVALDLRAWPSDEQTAVFKFGSRELTADELDLKLHDYKHVTVFEMGNWMIVSATGSEEALGTGSATRRAVQWVVVLRRRAAAHAVAASAVLAAAVLLLMAAAVMPPQARAPLCAGAAFTTALWLISALLRLPGAATYPRLLGVMAGVCGSAGAWCACAALVAALARLTRAPPPALRALLASAPAWSIATSPTQENPESASATWAAAAQLLDNCLRALLALVLLILLCLAL